MLTPAYKVVFDDTILRERVTFDYITHVNVKTSIRNFTDTATITIPRNIKYQGKKILRISQFLRPKMKVTISAGLKGLETIFKGYITSINNGYPLVITCENEAYMVKQAMAKAEIIDHFKISDYINSITSYKFINPQIADVSLGEVRINEDTSLAKVFEYIMQNYPLNFYFKNDTFYGVTATALQVANNDTKKHYLDIGWNTISDNLKYQRAEDVNVQVIVKSINRNNTTIETKYPQNVTDAEIRTFLVNDKTQAEIELYAKNKLTEIKVDKVTGQVTMFGLPLVSKGDIVHIDNTNDDDINDKEFWTEGVEYDGSTTGGLRQIITLGNQIK